MIPSETLLVTLIKRVDQLPEPPQPVLKRGRGRPTVYADNLFLKALILMIVRRLHKVGELLSVLEQPTPEMQTLRELLTCQGHFPSRRTWERRLAKIPDTLPARIGCLGRHLVERLQPWAQSGRAVAIDSTVFKASGGVWHKKDRLAGKVPHTRIDTQAHWTKSGWHGWVYGWKLHLCCTVGPIWIPLAAELTAANVADSEQAPTLLLQLPGEARFVLGDRHYHTAPLQAHCEQRGRMLVATAYGKKERLEAGVEVRRLFQRLRSTAIENFNQQFKGIFSAHEQVPTKGKVATKRFALGAVLLYQMALMYRHEQKMDLRVGLKPFLRAA